MATEQHTCISISCDVCHEPMEDGEGGVPHFPDLAEAAKFDESWLIDEKEQLCPACRCERDGHGRLVSFGGISGRWCERCDEHVPDEEASGE